MEYLNAEYCNELNKLGFNTSKLPYFWKGARFTNQGKEYKKLERIQFELISREEAEKSDASQFFIIPAWEVDDLFTITSQTIFTKFEISINSRGGVFKCKACLEYGCNPFFKYFAYPSLAKNLYAAIMWLHQIEDEIEFSFDVDGLLISELLAIQGKKEQDKEPDIEDLFNIE